MAHTDTDRIESQEDTLRTLRREAEEAHDWHWVAISSVALGGLPELERRMERAYDEGLEELHSVCDRYTDLTQEEARARCARVITAESLTAESHAATCGGGERWDD